MFDLLALFVLGAPDSGGLVAGEVEVVAEGFQFTEGPVWLPSEGLIFSDIPADTIYRADKSVFRQPSGQSNGLIVDARGRLIACEHRNRRVTRTEKDGTVTVLADRFEGKRFNSPNDAVAAADGAVYFTDPPYGLEGGLKGPNAELDFCGVFRVDASGEVRALARDFKKPNGIALSPDGKTLYVADTEGGHVRAFDVAEDGSLRNDRVFFKVFSPDGMAVDARGNVWTTGGKAVTVVSPEGEQLEQIEFPHIPANCAFGDADGMTLYVTARTTVYKVRTGVGGKWEVGSEKWEAGSGKWAACPHMLHTTSTYVGQ